MTMKPLLHVFRSQSDSFAFDSIDHWMAFAALRQCPPDELNGVCRLNHEVLRFVDKTAVRMCPRLGDFLVDSGGLIGRLDECVPGGFAWLKP